MYDEPQYGGLIDWHLIKTFFIIFGAIALIFVAINKISNVMFCQFFNTCQVTALPSYSWLLPVLLLTVLIFLMLLYGPAIR